MRCQSESAAEQHRRNVDTRVEVIRRSVRNDGSGGDADECVNYVPDAVDVRDLVGKELNEIQANGKADDPPVVQYIETSRQLCKAKLLDQSEHRDSGIEVYPGCPGGA